MSDDLNDILGQITYVIAHYDDLDKETIVSVLKAALVEVLELRMTVAVARRDAGTESTSDDFSSLLGDLTYVTTNYDQLDKETVVGVLNAALTEISDMRVEAAGKPQE